MKASKNFEKICQHDPIKSYHFMKSKFDYRTAIINACDRLFPRVEFRIYLTMEKYFIYFHVINLNSWMKKRFERGEEKGVCSNNRRPRKRRGKVPRKKAWNEDQWGPDIFLVIIVFDFYFILVKKNYSINQNFILFQF